MEDIENKMAQLLLCGICLDTYKNPKTLSCGHSFCRRCLELTYKNKNILLCPSCRCQEDKIISQADVGLLGTSLHLKQTMEMFAKDNLLDSCSFDTVQQQDDDEAGVVNDLKPQNVAKQDFDASNSNPGQSCNFVEHSGFFTSEEEEDENDVMKKNADISDFDSDTDDEETQRERIRRLLKKPKKTGMKRFIEKLSNGIFGNCDVLQDVLHGAHNLPIDSQISKAGGIGEVVGKSKIGDTSIVVEQYSKLKASPNITSNSFFCAFCVKNDHNIEHCPSALKAIQHQKKKEYAKTVAFCGAGYIAKQHLTNRRTAGMKGYSASQDCSRDRDVSSKKKSLKKRSCKSKTVSSRGGHLRCGRGGRRGTGRGSGLVVLLK